MPYICYPPQHSFLDFPERGARCITIYFSGCDFGCKECHNKELQSVNRKDDLKEIDQAGFSILLEVYSQKFRTTNLCLMGGDPYSKYNREFVKEFIESNTKYRVCVYTGYEVVDAPIYSLDKNPNYTKYSIYDKKLKQLPEKTDDYFRLASTNQYILDKNLNLLTNHGTLYYDLWRN